MPLFLRNNGQGLCNPMCKLRGPGWLPLCIMRWWETTVEGGGRWWQGSKPGSGGETKNARREKRRRTRSLRGIRFGRSVQYDPARRFPLPGCCNGLICPCAAQGQQSLHPVVELIFPVYRESREVRSGKYLLAFYRFILFTHLYYSSSTGS